MNSLKAVSYTQAVSLKGTIPISEEHPFPVH